MTRAFEPIAAGADVERLRDAGVEGVVVGRAFLDGRLPLSLLGA